MAIKDFSILLEKIETARTKKDISVVSGFNAIAQYIEHILKTQKGELISNMSLGSDYFTYVYGTNDVGVLEMSLAAYIQAAIVKLNNVKVKLLSQSDQLFQFQVTFSIFDGIRYQDNVSCLIEVKI
jgi:phage baseplate assembly protein W